MLPCQFVYIYVQYMPDTFLVFVFFSSDGVSLEVPALKNP